MFNANIRNFFLSLWALFVLVFYVFFFVSLFWDIVFTLLFNHLQQTNFLQGDCNEKQTLWRTFFTQSHFYRRFSLRTQLLTYSLQQVHFLSVLGLSQDQLLVIRKDTVGLDVYPYEVLTRPKIHPSTVAR